MNTNKNATAAGKEMDCVSHNFCPKLAIVEDPACGSAHCQIADYWSGELGKKTIYAYQASNVADICIANFPETAEYPSAEKRCWWRFQIL
ncbi:MAG: PhzF family phenazine biosynthesis protein [Pseudoscardovia radai]|nr:PhzF family phenazine biosynthesis protein [Pseudoscardovia radai]